MIVYQLRFKNLPRFEKHFASEDALVQFIDTCSEKSGDPIVKVREIPDHLITIKRTA
jgi:hypothetical protein